MSILSYDTLLESLLQNPSLSPIITSYTKDRFSILSNSGVPQPVTGSHPGTALQPALGI